jgi:hypothetical protein
MESTGLEIPNFAQKEPELAELKCKMIFRISPIEQKYPR